MVESLGRLSKNIYVCGKTQSGKSTLIKKLTGKYIKIGNGNESCTKDLQAYPVNARGQTYQMVDSPGLCDSDGGDKNTLVMVKNSLKRKPLNCFLFILSDGDAFDVTVQSTIAKIQYLFREEGNDLNRFCFLLTKVDVEDADDYEEEV